jgi:hypothetical protein
VEEICDILSGFESEEPTDFSFASFLDLTRGTTTFIAHDRQIQTVLQNIFSVSFRNNLAIYDSFIMRKEIGPKLADYFIELNPYLSPEKLQGKKFERTRKPVRTWRKI